MKTLIVLFCILTLLTTSLYAMEGARSPRYIVTLYASNGEVIKQWKAIGYTGHSYNVGLSFETVGGDLIEIRGGIAIIERLLTID